MVKPVESPALHVYLSYLYLSLDLSVEAVGGLCICLFVSVFVIVFVRPGQWRLWGRRLRSGLRPHICLCICICLYLFFLLCICIYELDLVSRGRGGGV